MSNWSSDYIAAGIAKIESGGTVVKVYTRSGSSSSMSFNGKRARNAYWSGGYVIVELENGERRRYDSGGSWSNC